MTKQQVTTLCRICHSQSVAAAASSSKEFMNVGRGERG